MKLLSKIELTITNIKANRRFFWRNVVLMGLCFVMLLMSLTIVFSGIYSFDNNIKGLHPDIVATTAEGAAEGGVNDAILADKLEVLEQNDIPYFVYSTLPAASTDIVLMVDDVEYSSQLGIITDESDAATTYISGDILTFVDKNPFVAKLSPMHNTMIISTYMLRLYGLDEVDLSDTRMGIFVNGKKLCSLPVTVVDNDGEFFRYFSWYSILLPDVLLTQAEEIPVPLSAAEQKVYISVNDYDDYQRVLPTVERLFEQIDNTSQFFTVKLLSLKHQTYISNMLLLFGAMTLVSVLCNYYVSLRFSLKSSTSSIGVLMAFGAQEKDVFFVKSAESMATLISSLLAAMVAAVPLLFLVKIIFDNNGLPLNIAYVMPSFGILLALAVVIALGLTALYLNNVYKKSVANVLKNV